MASPPFNELPLRPDGHWTHPWFRYWQDATDVASALAAEIARAMAAEALLAPKASPTFTGTATFANISVAGTVSGAGFVAWAASPPAIGGTTPAAGRFAALSAVAGLIVDGGYSYNIWNAGTALPTSGAIGGSAIGWNFTNGRAEVDYFNTTTSLTPDYSHIFWQRAGGSATRLMDIDAVGNVTAYARFVVHGFAGPTWTGGTGVPTTVEPIGSMFSRTDGGIGSTLYVSRGGGVWNGVAGV